MYYENYKRVSDKNSNNLGEKCHYPLFYYYHEHDT